MCICEFRYIWNPNSISGSWRSAKFTNSRFFALVSPRLRWYSRGSWHLANSGGLPRAGSSFAEDGPPVVQLLGIVVNWEKSHLLSHQKTFYLGVLLDSVSFRAYPAQKRFNKLLLIGSLFLSCVDQSAESWLELMGMLSSLTLLIPGVRLRMRSFQFALHRAWDRLDPDAFVRWSSEIRQDLFWWFDRKRLKLVISLEQVSSQLDLWSNSSDVGW